MTNSQEKIAHLQFTQEIITRMAHNSFLVKGWSITLIVALFAISVKDDDRSYAIVALLPAVMFWLLDAFFLKQERLFRHLYQLIAENEIKSETFSLDTKLVKQHISYIRVVLSKTLILFHGCLLATVFFVIYGLGCF